MLLNRSAPVPSGDKKSTPQRKGPGLFFAAVLIAMSFMTLIIPLAVYHLAQVGAAVKLRTALALMGLVIAISFLGGIFLGVEPLITGGLVGAMWAPILATGLFCRSKGKGMWPSVVVFLVPLFSGLAVLYSAPQIPNLQSWIVNRVDSHLQQTKEAIAPSDEAALQRFAMEEEALKKLMNESSLSKAFDKQEFQQLAKVASYGRWERFIWLVFGDGSGLYLFLLSISLGNLLLLDIAFAQVERIRALKTYLSAKQEFFPQQLLARLEGFKQAVLSGTTLNEDSTLGAEKEVARQEFFSGVRVLGHEKEKSPTAASERSFAGFLRALIRPKRPREEVSLWGYIFRFSKGPWELKYFSLPLPLVLLSIVCLCSIGFWSGDLEGLMQFANSGVLFAGWNVAPFMVCAAALGFLLISVVAFQGVAVLYLRLPPLLLLAFLLVFLLTGSYGGLQPLLVLSLLSGLGLLDYVYDLRGRLAKQSLSL